MHPSTDSGHETKLLHLADTGPVTCQNTWFLLAPAAHSTRQLHMVLYSETSINAHVNTHTCHKNLTNVHWIQLCKASAHDTCRPICAPVIRHLLDPAPLMTRPLHLPDFIITSILQATLCLCQHTSWHCLALSDYSKNPIDVSMPHPVFPGRLMFHGILENAMVTFHCWNQWSLVPSTWWFTLLLQSTFSVHSNVAPLQLTSFSHGTWPQI